ncbi:hypothetical protein RRF57_008163 [Xylaria bambusicola]|uniref:Uncharacterized protein n=1 Tax=Xylaria bambusicola TaxID=326684 RepID=A0AAN7V1F6_9PEZI
MSQQLLLATSGVYETPVEYTLPKPSLALDAALMPKADEQTGEGTRLMIGSRVDWPNATQKSKLYGAGALGGVFCHSAEVFV